MKKNKSSQKTNSKAPQRKIIEQINKERLGQRGEFLDYGVAEGTERAQEASRDELVEALQMLTWPQMGEPTGFPSGEIEEVFDGPRMELSGPEFRAYFRGWLMGVYLFWRSSI